MCKIWCMLPEAPLSMAEAAYRMVKVVMLGRCSPQPVQNSLSFTVLPLMLTTW